MLGDILSQRYDDLENLSNIEYITADISPQNKRDIKKDITNDSLYVERAKLNIKKERYEEALRDLNTSLDLDSTFGHAHFVLGEIRAFLSFLSRFF